MERGLYIHIPFCIKKCNYCDFNSFIITKDYKDRYIKSLIKEMKMYSKKLKENNFDTVFLGGGTPTILNTEELKYIFENIYKYFTIKKEAEITIEANPGTLDKRKLECLYKMGVNRISIGLQAYQQKHLAYLGRIHSYEEFERNFKEAKEIGFKNINVDLMFSLPNQTIDDWKETLQKIADLNPQHISAYSLILEEGTPFYDMYEKNELRPLDEEIDLKMYHYTREYLISRGYNQYEISNFSKPNHECIHNIIYWKCGEYLGLGPGAHSYLDGIRHSNFESLKEYFENLQENKTPIENKQELSIKEKIEEKIFMGLRMNKGLSFGEFYDEFKINFMEINASIVQKLKKQDLIDYNKDRIYLTKKGIDVSNKVFVEFLND